MSEDFGAQGEASPSYKKIDKNRLFYYIVNVSLIELLKRLVRPTGLFCCQKPVFMVGGLFKDLWNTHLTKALSIMMSVQLL